MKTRSEVDAKKLRGGFYTPDSLVQFCLGRLQPLLKVDAPLTAVEPSAGDGAFLRGISANRSIAERVSDVLAIEPLELEAEKCRRRLSGGSLRGNVAVESAIAWGSRTDAHYDIALGNPPFVRYQFLSPDDKAQIGRLGERVGLSFAGVSNLWIPVLVAALARLRPGGAFSFVLPTELMTGLSASRLRQWLASNFEMLRIDLFEPRSFPEVLQEVAVFSGRRAEQGARSKQQSLTIAEHHQGAERAWSHALDPTQPNWTRYLLTAKQLLALDDALAFDSVQPLGSLARFQVSVVTGANDFFSVTDAVQEEFELEPWSRPLLPRIRHAPGLIYDPSDQIETLRAGARGWLLDFSEDAPDPTKGAAARYLRDGKKRQLHKRYKCRIREPWFRVPHIERGSLMLSKRSHLFPRVIVNEADAYTTDTIYRGDPIEGAGVSARGISAAFHSSLSLLTAELEGRSFGGGVLELVPSEIERLAVAVAPGAEDWIEHLDAVAREGGEEDALVQETDAALARSGALDAEVLRILGEARMELMGRRLARNERSAAKPAETLLAA